MKTNTGKSCEEWTTGYGDDIKPMLNEYLDGKDCAALKEMRDSNGDLKKEEYGNAAKYISDKYNKKFTNAVDIGWFEKWFEGLIGWQTKLTEVAQTTFETHEIDITNENGDTETFNAIDYYFAQKLLEKCGEEYQAAEAVEKPVETVVEGTAVGF